MIIIYVPCPHSDVAEVIAKRLIELDLAFCVQIKSPVKSFYKWESQLQNDLESPLIIKTFKSFEEAITKEIQQIHPYETPCILSFEVSSLNPAFSTWASTIQK